VAGLTAAVVIGVERNDPGPDDTPPLRLADPRADRGGMPLHVREVAARVEKLRGLEFRRPPTVAVMTPEQLAALSDRLQRRLERRTPASQLARIERLQEAVNGFEELAGIVPEAQATEATAQPTERIGGAYDYRHKRVILVEGAIEDRHELQMVLAHELVHALEDQRLSLRLPASIGPTQKAQTRRALIEGTATLVATRYGRRYLGDELPTKQRLTGQSSLFAGGSTPYAIKAASIFNYVEGPLFVRRLGRPADGWTAVNRALRRPPTRTQQILHPGRWRRSVDPRPVRLQVGRLLGAGWRRVGSGPAGEQDALAILGIGARYSAETGAAGWAGGRFALWRPRDQAPDCENCVTEDVGAIGLRWRARSDAHEFARAFFAYMLIGRLAERLGRHVWRLRSGNFAALGVARRSSAVVFAPSRPLASALARSAALTAGGGR
jgi:hypothetical protein